MHFLAQIDLIIINNNCFYSVNSDDCIADKYSNCSQMFDTQLDQIFGFAELLSTMPRVNFHFPVFH